MRKQSISIAFVIITAVAALSCTQNKVSAVLDDIETYIEARPDSALAVLETLDAKNLNTKAQRAHYALLYSIALDKNYIDTTDASIITPAIEYYHHHGSATQKLKALYYRGRIAMNAQQYEDAMQYFIAGEKYASRTKNKKMAGMLYKAETQIYVYCYDSKSMIASASKAAEYYIAAKDTSKYINAISDIISAYLGIEDYTNAKANIDIIKSYWNNLNPNHKSLYYSWLLFVYHDADKDERYNIINEYRNEVKDSSLYNWISIANAFISSEEYNEAENALTNHLKFGGARNSAYYLLSAKTNEAMNNPEAAMNCYRNYIELNDERNGYLFGTDLRFLEERHAGEVKNIRKNFLIIIIALGFCISIMTIKLIVDKAKMLKKEKEQERQEHEQEMTRIRQEQEQIKSEKQKYIEMYNETLQEIERLNKSIESTMVDPAIKHNIRERLDVLNNFIAANISPSYSKKAYKELDALMSDKTQFIESTRLSFVIAHPQFLKYLRNRGLSDNEIGYCCLYVIGLKGKDIANYMGDSGHYKFSSNLRKKLGLNEHDTNIDIHLRKLAEQLQ